MTKWIFVLSAIAACSSPHSGPGGGSGDAEPPGALPVDPDPPASPGSPVATGGDPFARLAELPATCSADHWCWRTPHPAGNDYSHVYSTSPENVWLLGDHGTVMQWDGAAWRFHHPPVQAGQPTAQAAASIAGRGPDDMWLIYDATIQHWDGTAWTIRDAVPPDGIVSFDSIWEAPNGDVWVTMSTGELDHSIGGAAFQRIDTGCNCFLGSIWGTAADNFWIASLPGTILHSDGHTYKPSYTGTSPIGSFVGTGKDDVWVSGLDGTLVHWNGAAWTKVPAGLPATFASGTITGVAATASNDVWWWATASSASSAFLHWDGAAITVTPVDTTSNGTLLYAGAIIDGKWWLVGGAGAIYTRTGPATIAPVVDPHVMNIEAMWGSADDDMYFATGDALRRWDGTAMTILPVAANAIAGVRTAGVDELFATGFELTADRTHYIADAFHYDGTAWTKTQLDRSLIADHRYFTKVWAIGPGEAMAVGYGGLAYHYASGVWTPVQTGVTTDLSGIWGPDADHLWLTGAHGTFLEWQRSAPDLATPDPAIATTEDLGAMHGAGGVAWIASGATDVLMSSPAGWTKIAAGIAVGDVFCTDASHVVIASPGQSQLARWNGSAFVREDTAAGMPTPVLFQPPGGTMLAGGLHALVAHP